jgi:hypothetical protein
MEDVAIVYRTLVWDLPLALAQYGRGNGGEREAVETAWKAYDAAMRLATTATDDLYRTPLFGAMINSIAASLAVGGDRAPS